MTDNRALWELVGKWRAESRSCGMGGFAELSAFHEIAADELAAILERPVGVSDEQVEDAFQHACEVMGGYRTKLCRKAVRAALESMVRGKS